MEFEHYLADLAFGDLKEIIHEKYEDKLKEAKNRLCSKCVRGYPHYCHLLPINSDGSDCIYFEEKL